ncbi:MAG: hypothetical protein KY476_08435 [Planctomycetes bacterium]|nr:hypothetical protein [Planctomycetota bacterium]
MRQLVRRGNAGKLTEAEQEELDEFRQVGLMLDLVHAKARRALSGDADR